MCKFPQLADNIVMSYESSQEAAAFAQALEAEGISVGPSSHCVNIVDRYPIRSKAMIHPDLPPFGPGFAGERAVYDSRSNCPNTDDIVNRYVAVGIGPLFTDQDMDDFILTIRKVEEGLYPKSTSASTSK